MTPSATVTSGSVAGAEITTFLAPAARCFDAFYERLHPLLDYLLPQYLAEGKAHLVVAIGCTGGRHRSVAIANHLMDRYGDSDDYLVEVAHRDADRPA